MSALQIILVIALVVVCLLMLLLILMQRPRQEGLGAAFGVDMTSQMFGSRTTDVLQRGTVYLVIAFFVLSIAIALLTAKETEESLATGEGLSKLPVPEEPAAPVGGAAPAETTTLPLEVTPGPAGEAAPQEPVPAPAGESAPPTPPQGSAPADGEPASPADAPAVPAGEESDAEAADGESSEPPATVVTPPAAVEPAGEAAAEDSSTVPAAPEQ